MSAQKRGRQYENRLFNELDRETDKSVIIAGGGGMSGNTAAEQADIVVLKHCGGINVKVYAIEVKKGTKDRFYIAAEDLEQLWRYASAEWVEAVIVMKFNNREPVVIKLGPHIDIDSGEYVSLPEDAEAPQIAQHAVRACPTAFAPHATKKGSLRLDKPSTKDWSSSSAGRSDVQTVMDKLQL